MHVVLATHALARVGGSETYLHTVAGNLVRLGHRVTVYAAQLGPMADEVRAVGADVVMADDLPDSCDGVLVQDVGMAYDLAERWPHLPQVVLVHSAYFDLNLPPVFPVSGSVAVVLNERNAQRVRAMPVEIEMVRLRQPIDSQRLAPRGGPQRRPRRALLLGNYLEGPGRDHLVSAWSQAKVEVVQAGNVTRPTLDVAAAIAEADIVVGKGRAVLDAMSCGRPAFVYDAFGADGWVTAESYERLEADGFAGQSDLRVLSSQDLLEALDRYDPGMGHVNRELVLKHHQDRRHAEALVGLFDRLAGVQGAAPTQAAELARLSRLRWRAEQESNQLRRQVEVLTSRLRTTEAQLLLAQKRRRIQARAARRAEARLAELTGPTESR